MVTTRTGFWRAGVSYTCLAILSGKKLFFFLYFNGKFYININKTKLCREVWFQHGYAHGPARYATLWSGSQDYGQVCSTMEFNIKVIYSYIGLNTAQSLGKKVGFL